MGRDTSKRTEASDAGRAQLDVPAGLVSRSTLYKGVSMSKKDYQAIAAAIYNSQVRMDGLFKYDRNAVMVNAGVKAAMCEVKARLADVLAADNPRFSRERFLEACETGRCRGMRQVA
jgi:hypothetical protein